LRVDEATQLTTDDGDLKHHRSRIRRLKNGLGGEKPLWRHSAKLLRAYMRAQGCGGVSLHRARVSWTSARGREHAHPCLQGWEARS
jgi:integrase